MIAILILTALAGFAVLVTVAVLVMGHGGQLARFEADHPPLDLPADRPVTGRDVARIRLPLALWGYHVRAVDEVLDRVAADIEERDTRIAQLEARLGDRGSSAERPRVWYPRSPRETSSVGEEERQSPDTEDPDADPWQGTVPECAAEYAEQQSRVAGGRR
ncbi:DivIVA domain-containing protein [Thermobifida cellulosilytica]|uniref:DivIVA domain-containing protein n=1 Tax=Thermobifida cellulosilytica TaxID=144786 RepID=UPI000ADF52BB|nr:DivIVA domain-containing protein [Thermobifida cellulosilytica]